MKVFKICCVLFFACLTVTALGSVAWASSVTYDWIESEGVCPKCGAAALYYHPSYFNSPLGENGCGSYAWSCSSCNQFGADNPGFGPPHTWVEFSRIDPTCLSSGVAVYHCSVCHVIEKAKILPALGGEHTWTETSRIDATTTAPGSIEYTCSRCNDTKTETIPQLPAPSTPSGSMTMPQLLSTMTSVFNEIFQWIAAVSAAIASNPILLLCVVIGFTSTGVVLFRRLLNL